MDKERTGNQVSISINPEIRAYAESVFLGLTLRQTLFSIVGCGISIGIWLLLHARWGIEAVSWACILGMLPCGILGFVKYNGMPAEHALAAIFRFWLMPKRLAFRAMNLWEEMK